MQKSKLKAKSNSLKLKSFYFLVLVLSFSFLVFRFQKAHATLLYAGAANQTVYQGDTFVIDWFLDTEGVSYNALNLKLNYSNQTLQALDVSIAGSALSLLVSTPSINQQAGQIDLAGGAPHGFSGTNIPIVRTTFKATGTGVAQITMNAQTQLLQNDGLGTSATLKFKPLVFNVVEASQKPTTITSSTHPDQNIWYRNKDISIRFEAKPNTLYSYSFSSNLDIIPDQIEDYPDNINYTNYPDGIYYFKLNSKVSEGVWQEAGVFRVQIDSTPPEEFIPLIGSDPNIFGGRKFISFSTVDKTSGISHYKVKFGRFDFTRNASFSPVQIPKWVFGNQIKVIAVDLAGNERETMTAYHGIPEWLVYILAMMVLGLLAWLVKIKKLKIK